MSSLYLFTENFPYGKGEAFVEEELKVMAQKFARVYIFPLHKVEGLRSLPANVSVVDLFENDTYKGLKTLRQHTGLYVSVLLKELAGVKYKAAFVKNIREHSSILLKAIAKSEILDKAIDRSTDNVYYSFWLYEWATILSILKKRKKIERYFARAHSFDIYGEYFRKDKIIPFRNLQLKYVTKIFPDSMQGVIALREQTRIYKDKVQIGYMGGIDYGMNAYVNDDVVKIVSCSFVVPRKRVELIVEALKQANVKVKWLHIGDGPDLEKIKAMAAQLPPTITC